MSDVLTERIYAHFGQENFHQCLSAVVGSSKHLCGFVPMQFTDLGISVVFTLNTGSTMNSPDGACFQSHVDASHFCESNSDLISSKGNHFTSRDGHHVNC